MNPQIAPDQRVRVEEFRRRHRIGLVTQALNWLEMAWAERTADNLGVFTRK